MQTRRSISVSVCILAMFWRLFPRTEPRSKTFQTGSAKVSFSSPFWQSCPSPTCWIGRGWHIDCNSVGIVPMIASILPEHPLHRCQISLQIYCNYTSLCRVLTTDPYTSSRTHVCICGMSCGCTRHSSL